MFQVPGTVPSVVLDVGSHTVKAGLSGEDLPHTLFVSRLQTRAEDGGGGGGGGARRVPPDVLTVRPPAGADVANPFDADGLVDDWRVFEGLVEHALRSELCVDTDAHAVLYSEPVHNKRAARERLVELFFETFNAPAAYLAKAPVLAAYASSRTTGVVLDLGHSGVSAVPVLEGALVKGKYLRSSVGGAAVTAALKAQLDAAGHALRPLWTFRRSVARASDSDDALTSSATPVNREGVTKSFHDFAVIRIVEEAKAGICRARDSPGSNAAAAAAAQEVTWELPDGNVITMGTERFDAVEKTLCGLLPHADNGTDPDHRQSYVQQMVNNVATNATSSGGPKVSNGLHGLVLDAIQLCDQSTHRDMYAGVCLTGGSSTLPGVYERISAGLTETYHKVRVLAAIGSMERKYCAWTGGSILGTFSEFQKMWISKGEYMESGASFVHRRE